MRTVRTFILGALGVTVVFGAGCAGRLPEPQAPTMVRSFHGTLVPGYYVSPAAYQHYVQAQLLSNDGRAEEAAEELRHALASDGASAYLRTRLAEELLALGRVDEAREEVEAALHLDSEFPEAWVDLGRVKLRLGDLGGAEVMLKKAIALDPACEDAYVQLAGIYRERGLDARTEETWAQLAKAVPTSVAAHHALGRAAAARDDQKTAEIEWKRALELDPGLQDARVALAQLYQGEGRVPEAAALFADAYERSGDTKIAEMLVRLDMAAAHESDARELVDRIDDEGRIDEALAQLRKVPLSAAEYVPAQQRIGRLLRDNGRYREATEQVARAIAQIATAYTNAAAADPLEELLAEIHERAGEPAAGIRELEQALQKRPHSAPLALALGAAYQRAGQWQKALELVEKGVLAHDPESAPALNFVGYLMAEHDLKLDEAKKLLERARALKPSSGEIADSLGWVFVKLGRLDRAEQLLLRADRLSPEEPEILQHLGELYARKSERQKAIDAYQRALRGKPDEKLRHLCEQQILLLETGRVGSR
jgi:tetratricopeptide (TPR) repeat protein